MKTEKLKQNVKGYVHQFEDGGLRLLRKGQKGVIHAIFSRFGLVLILLLLQVGLLFSIFRWFGNLWPHYFGGSVVVTSAMVIYLLNSKMDNSAKITWMVVIAIAPVVGIPMFFYVKSNFGHNILRKRLLELEDQLRGWLPQSQKAVEQLKALEPGAASLAKYLYGRGGGFPVYENTAMTYFPGGEAKFEELLRQLETAEEYIFVEYFIIDEGLMWGKILEVLARKALQGVAPTRRDTVSRSLFSGQRGRYRSGLYRKGHRSLRGHHPWSAGNWSACRPARSPATGCCRRYNHRSACRR